jgi:hypothetical protein
VRTTVTRRFAPPRPARLRPAIARRSAPPRPPKVSAPGGFPSAVDHAAEASVHWARSTTERALRASTCREIRFATNRMVESITRYHQVICSGSGILQRKKKGKEVVIWKEVVTGKEMGTCKEIAIELMTSSSEDSSSGKEIVTGKEIVLKDQEIVLNDQEMVLKRKEKKVNIEALFLFFIAVMIKLSCAICT